MPVRTWLPICLGQLRIVVVAPLLWLLAGLLASSAIAQSTEDEDEFVPDRPGLILKLSDRHRQVHLLDARMLLLLQPGESPHPQIAAEGYRAEWRGRLNIQQPGSYRFRAETTGQFSLSMDGAKLIESGPAAAEHAAPSKVVELPFGEIPIEAAFEPRGGQPAELRLFWQLDNGPWELVPPVALGHPAAYETDEFTAWQQLESARRDLVELRCTRCHAASEPQQLALALEVDRAADLSDLGHRVSPAWLFHWLQNPHALRPGTNMPAMFGSSETEQVDLHAAVAYLSSLGEPAKPTNRRTADAAAPEFPPVLASTGCVACHAMPGEAEPHDRRLRPLEGVGSKYSPEALARRISQPWAHHPDSRMPDFKLSDDAESLNKIVAYLSASRRADWETMPSRPAGADLSARYRQIIAGAAEQRAFAELSPAAQWQHLGRAVVETRGCLACHALPATTPRHEARGLSQVLHKARSNEGCLANRPVAGTPVVPNYQLNAARTSGLVDFLATLDEASANAPRFAAEVQLDRLGCTACHSRGGRGGLFAERITNFVPLGTDETLRDVAPPELTAIGEKLQHAAIHRVLIGEARARPWMPLKMPLYQPNRIEHLADDLVLADGVAPPKGNFRRVPTPSFVATTAASSDELADIGRLLIGRTGMNCVSCHDIRGVPSTGVRGPDLALVTARVTPEWFRRWMLDPQRISPGTRMPTVFFGGQSAAPQYLGGDPTAQMAAMWTYLSLGAEMPMPVMPPAAGVLVAGGENPKPQVGDRPILARGFMPGVAGLRGIALGTPAGVHFAFDSQRCALTAAWQGEFVEIHGWTGPGRGDAHEMGTLPLAEPFWRGPGGPIVTAVDPKAGFAHTPEVQFLACWAHQGDAGFRWKLLLPEGEWITVEERPTAQPGDTTTFLREMVITGPTSSTLEFSLSEFEPTGKTPVEGAIKPGQTIPLGPLALRLVDAPPGAHLVIKRSTPATPDSPGHAVAAIRIPPIERAGGTSLRIEYIHRAEAR